VHKSAKTFADGLTKKRVSSNGLTRKFISPETLASDRFVASKPLARHDTTRVLRAAWRAFLTSGESVAVWSIRSRNHNWRLASVGKLDAPSVWRWTHFAPGGPPWQATDAV